MSVDELTKAIGTAVTAPSPTEGPLAIEVRGVEKTFRIPTHRIDSLKERAVHPFAPIQYRELHALRGISFDVHRGEFFGIVGRNGSGKSTLLKILASIYRADAGRIRVAGRVAPFIELGVGFDPNLTARENVALNGVMMGLTAREARRRLDAVLDFAELREFIDLKLKNYSTGMNVRLAFSTMVHADSDILLIDEVIAVGDAAFAQKCADVFWEMRDAGRTVVLVTHNMNAVQSYCHRAMLLHHGELLCIGNPEEVGRRYLQLNFAGGEAARAASGVVAPDLHARLIDAWLEDGRGDRVANVALGEPLRVNAVIEARAEIIEPTFALSCTSAEGACVFTVNPSVAVEEGQQHRLTPGQRVRIVGTIDNQLMPGRYHLNCFVARKRTAADLALQSLNLLKFTVFGTQTVPGLVSVPSELVAVPDEEEDS